MYTDISTNNNYPKTLMIRNHKGGLVWQVYHVQKQKEADMLERNAYQNGFFGSTLEDYQPEIEETWPDWRETEGGKEIIKSGEYLKDPVPGLYEGVVDLDFTSLYP